MTMRCGTSTGQMIAPGNLLGQIALKSIGLHYDDIGIRGNVCKC